MSETIARYGAGMQGAKNRQIEQWEAGHLMDLDENLRGVCPDCIADDGLPGSWPEL